MELGRWMDMTRCQIAIHGGRDGAKILRLGGFKRGANRLERDLLRGRVRRPEL